MSSYQSPDASAPDRVATLDFIRGSAVMGILLANLPAFALPAAAYFSPLAWGGTSPADVAVWFANFVLIEGKMRGLFSLLFGASLLLVLERAQAAGERPLLVHARRMAALFAIGCAHLYLVWDGDILAHYALCGLVAVLFASLPARHLVAAAVAFAAWYGWLTLNETLAVFGSAAQDTPRAVELWREFVESFGAPPHADLTREIAIRRGPYLRAVAERWRSNDPLAELPWLAPETLSAMLLGMAAWRSGFLAGAWSRAAYRRVAIVTLATALPVYTLFGIATISHAFDPRWVHLASITGGALLRLPATIGLAAVLLLIFRADGNWCRRVTAVGRAAFTNYLGTSLVMVALFDGAGLFGSLSRWSLYLLAPPAFALMLAWSRPWLAHHPHGPFEWFWRSVARGQRARWKNENDTQ